jgi:hypothetical protein
VGEGGGMQVSIYPTFYEQLFQKNTNTNCKKRKASQNILYEKSARKMKEKLNTG